MEKGKIKNRPERRRYVRAKEYHLIKYIILDRFYMLSSTIDVGGAGARFSSRNDIAPGSLIEASINFPEEERQITVLGQVVRSAPVKDSVEFEIAVKFINLDDETRDFLQKKFPEIKKKQ